MQYVSANNDTCHREPFPIYSLFAPGSRLNKNLRILCKTASRVDVLVSFRWFSAAPSSNILSSLAKPNRSCAQHLCCPLVRSVLGRYRHTRKQVRVVRNQERIQSYQAAGRFMLRSGEALSHEVPLLRFGTSIP